MEQPTHYDSEDELVAWLRCDLYQQQISLFNEHGIEEAEDKYLYLNIGKIGDLSNKLVINFDFSINRILLKLGRLNYKIDFNIQCSNINFNCIADFSYITFNGIADFSNTIFNKDTFFNNIKFGKNTIFKYSIFKEVVNFGSTHFKGDVYFFYAVFNGHSNFTQNIFYKQVYFIKNSFNDNISFWLATFFEKSVFLLSTFIKKSDFSSVTIKQDLFIQVKVKEESKSEMIFDKINFMSDNALLKIKDCEGAFANISFKDILINGRLDIQNVKTENVDFMGTVVNGGVVNTVKFDVKNFANRESALFLKHQAYIMHNNIEALQYKSKEMEIHRSDLKKIKNKTWENWAEILSMFLSRVSNNHGQNWLQAIGFTILVPLLFFTIFYSPTLDMLFNMQKNYYDSLLPSFVEYFIPTKYEQVINYAGYKSINIFVRMAGIFIYLVGKIAFGYGSVQVVQAFRKYNKSS